jgi:hypothetical protein
MRIIKTDTIHKLNYVIKCSLYPPKYPLTIANTASYSNLDLCYPGRCDSAAVWQCRGSSVRPLGPEGYLYSLIPSNGYHGSDRPDPLPGA